MKIKYQIAEQLYDGVILSTLNWYREVFTFDKETMKEHSKLMNCTAFLVQSELTKSTIIIYPDQVKFGEVAFSPEDMMKDLANNFQQMVNPIPFVIKDVETGKYANLKHLYDEKYEVIWVDGKDNASTLPSEMHAKALIRDLKSGHVISDVTETTVLEIERYTD